MKHFTVIATGLLIIAGIAIGVRSAIHSAPGSKSSSPLAKLSAEKAEDEDRPPPVTPRPEWSRRTRWNRLDETGTNHRCNQDSTQAPQNETPCAASPANPNVIIVGGNDRRGGPQATDWAAGFYRTTDGGNTWNDALLSPGQPTFELACDPAVAADLTGHFYAVYLAAPPWGSYGVYIQPSTDLGATWQPHHLLSSAGSPDKPFCACDNSPSSPHVGNLYVCWTNNSSVMVSRSADHGQTFSQPATVTGQAPGIGAMPACGPDGELYVGWVVMSNPSAIEFNKSTNGGSTWATARTISSCSGWQYTPGGCGTAYRVPNCPSLGCDITSGPRRGWVYACWTSRISGNDLDICFSRSTNGGQTWSTPVQVNVDPNNRFQFFPWLTVHPRTGDIAVSWMDCNQNAPDFGYYATGSISTDGGSTWSALIRIADHGSDGTSNPFIGDYTGCTFSAYGFFSSWPDLRNDDGDAYAAWWNDTMYVQLDAPQGGATWVPGQTALVTWHERYAGDSLFVELNRYYPSGNWERLGTAPCVADSFAWLVTGNVTERARLRLLSNHLATLGDTSDANFSIGMSVPQRVTAYRLGDDIRLIWQSTGAPYYHVYSAPSASGPFTTLEGSTQSTTFLDLGAVSDSLKFYVVRASTEP